MNAFFVAIVLLAASASANPDPGVVLAVHNEPLPPLAASQWRIQETSGPVGGVFFVIETAPPPIEQARGWAALPPEWLQASGLILMALGAVTLRRIDRDKAF